MKRLVLVRHGETDANRRRQLQGQQDNPLNAAGWQQARRVAEALRSEQFEGIWSSPLRRAHDTARCIQQLQNCPVVEDNALKERSFGHLEGEPVRRLYELEAAHHGSKFDLVIPGGESIQDLYKRSGQLLHSIYLSDVQSLLLVGHAGLFRPLIGQLLNLETERWFSLPQHNACINTFSFDDERRLVAWHLNDHAHCE